MGLFDFTPEQIARIRSAQAQQQAAMGPNEAAAYAAQQQLQDEDFIKAFTKAGEIDIPSKRKHVTSTLVCRLVSEMADNRRLYQRDYIHFYRYDCCLQDIRNTVLVLDF
jgi:hypothetical protein